MVTTVSSLRSQYVVCPPPPQWPTTDPPPAFIEALDINNALRSVVSAGLSFIPEAGGVLSGALKVLWPETTKPTLKWDQIKEGVKAIAQGLIEEHDAKDLKNRTEGLMNLLRTYANTSYGTTQKQDFLDDLLSWFDTNKSWYLNNEEPWLTVQLFVQMATMHMAVLHEQAFNWAKKLQDALNEYTDQIGKIRTKCLEWRFSKVEKTQWVQDGHNPFNQVSKCEVNDHFSGFHREYTSSGHYNSAARDYENLRDYVDITYREQIETYLSLSLCWPFFTFENKNGFTTVTRKCFMETGIAGNGEYYMSHFNDREFADQHGPITKIEIHAWDGVDGIEVWYGGQSSGLRGKIGGTVRTLDVGPGEEVICVSGRINTVVESIKFFINPSKKIGGGGNRDGYHTSQDTFSIGKEEEGVIPFNLRLKYLYGWYTGEENDPEKRGWVQQLGAVFEGTETVARAMLDAEAKAILQLD